MDFTKETFSQYLNGVYNLQFRTQQIVALFKGEFVVIWGPQRTQKGRTYNMPFCSLDTVTITSFKREKKNRGISLSLSFLSIL